MNVLSEAISRFKGKQYQEALLLFERAEAIYGRTVVGLHIERCRKQLGQQPHNASTTPSTALDPGTRIMLAHGGEAPLAPAELAELVAQWKVRTGRRSEDADTRPVPPVPTDWPEGLVLAPLPDGPNDFLWNRARRAREGRPSHPAAHSGLSIVIPTFNRADILDVTLACLANQQTLHAFEVVVADDGSREQIVDVVRRYESLLDIKYVRQKDHGYQLCAVRNLGLRTARHAFVAILDCDMAPNPHWVQSYMDLLLQDDDVALIGPRKYVDTHGMPARSFRDDASLIERLPEVMTHNTVAGKTVDAVSVDWRLDHFKATDDLRLCDSPFRYFSGGNVAFARKWLERAGWFDEEFNHWGGEDNEFGYRLFAQGCFFRAVAGAMAYHQEPPGKENETDRAEGKKVTARIVQEKVPYFYRKLLPIEQARMFRTPLVSIYIPAYNCAPSIVHCVNSALDQTITDLEVCICNDGATDNTREVLQQHFGHHPRVRIVDKANGGIGSASNAAVRLARGFYIGQLDSDDHLEPDAVELCLKAFLSDPKLACVYTTNRNVTPQGGLIAKGYNWPTYSREKMTTAMIVHHFRMFTRRAWHLTTGFDESIRNAVDYDMYLKLSEVGPFHHINKIAYNRVLHGDNTSIKHIKTQKDNHFLVVNNALKRQQATNYRYTPAVADDDTCRKYTFVRADEPS